MRGTSAEAEQRPVQRERLSQLSENPPQRRHWRSGVGAERFGMAFDHFAGGGREGRRANRSKASKGGLGIAGLAQVGKCGGSSRCPGETGTGVFRQDYGGEGR